MPDFTSNLGLRFANATDPADLVAISSNLAVDVDAILAVLGNMAEYVNNAPTVTFTTTAYADFTSASISFTKKLSTSKLLVSIDASGYVTGAQPTKIILGVKVNGSDFDVSRFNFNNLSDHRFWSGTATIPNIPAGTYTIQVRGKLDQTASARNGLFDTADSIAMHVRETT